jgi:hypothetical protein
MLCCYVLARLRLTATSAPAAQSSLWALSHKEQLPLIKVEAPAIRDVLIYLNPRCKVVIPSRTALRAGIAAAYNNALTAVASELDSASTKVNISFDL